MNQTLVETFNKNHFRPIRKIIFTSQGQAVIEYLLVLIVIVAIAVGLLYQFNGAFSRWASAYFGSYYACLLETGELPGISGSGGDSGICSQLYEKFSFTGGVPPRRDGSTGGGGGRGRRESPPPKPSSASESDSRNNKSGQASYVRAESGRSNSSSKNSFGSGSNSNRENQNQSRLKRESAREKKINTGSTEISLSSSLLAGGSEKQKIRISRIDNRYFLSQNFDQDRDQKISLSSKGDVMSAGNQKNDKIRINRKVAQKEQFIEDNEMTFGSFFRFLIIAAIIIALVVLLGGQGLQISKSWE